MFDRSREEHRGVVRERGVAVGVFVIPLAIRSDELLRFGAGIFGGKRGAHEDTLGDRSVEGERGPSVTTHVGGVQFLTARFAEERPS